MRHRFSDGTDGVVEDGTGTPVGPGHEVAFGAFRLVPQERTLYRDEQPVRLNGRAFDLLLALVEQAGAVVGKDELMARVWPHTVVEEGNLRVHVGALRKVLGGDQAYIENVVGRGYCFVAPLRVQQPVTLPAPAPAPAPALPRQPLVGRDAVLAQLAAQLPAQRLLTIVGPGGMGKSAVALALAARLAATFDGTVYCADLAAVPAAGQLVPALARLVQGNDGEPAAGMTAAALAHCLRHRRALLVLDGCEHLVDAVAALAERLLHDAPGVHLLATSREPLRAEGEQVHRLAPLALPPADQPATPALLAGCASVQLFVERAGADGGAFAVDRHNAQAVADVCRQLDGIPLALELAAGRAAFFGVHELALRLSDCFAVLTRGRRTALPRHQTLRATLDWSHDMLCRQDQAVLRRLAVFRGPFTLAAAAHVAHGDDVPLETVYERVANLTAKSLVGVETVGTTVQYRLLDTTRRYALEKLQRSGGCDGMHGVGCSDTCSGGCGNTPHGEWRAACERHAQYYAGLATPGQRAAHDGHWAEQVRAALAWATGPDGDPALARVLGALAAPPVSPALAAPSAG